MSVPAPAVDTNTNFVVCVDPIKGILSERNSGLVSLFKKVLALTFVVIG